MAESVVSFQHRRMFLDQSGQTLNMFTAGGATEVVDFLFGIPRASRDEETPAAIRRITAETAHAIARLIAADIDPEHQRTLAQGLVGLAEGVSRHLVERGKVFDPEVLAQQVADLAWAGLRAVHRNA